MLDPGLEGLGYCVGQFDINKAMELGEDDEVLPEENPIVLWRKERDGFRLIAMFGSLETAKRAVSGVARADFAAAEAGRPPPGTIGQDFLALNGEPKVYQG